MLPQENDIRPVNAPLLLGRYQPINLIGRGGSSLVFRGTDVTLGRDVAIKISRPGIDPEDYKKELRVLAGLSHHGVISIVDAGIDTYAPADPRPFLVMELVRGQTVGDTLRMRPLTTREIGGIGYEVAEALDYVHSQGVIHRDISPANIMLTDYGTSTARPRARITDFGIAIDHSIERDSEVRRSAMAYASPEQAEGRALTPASDIYSLGLVLLKCFTTEGASSDADADAETALARLESGPDIPKSVPKPWRKLIREMTSREIFDRPTAAKVQSGIRAILRRDKSVARAS